MRYLSLFSGIEAASAAWASLGWECVAVAEVEPFPCAVLAHHHPDVPNMGDVTKITEAQIQALGHIDVVVGGSPCQSFSVAGLRQGLADPRGNLLLEFLRIVDLARPRFVIWENVPGVLSDKTGAFDVLLDALGELGYSIDAQVLDAQEFGVAQRRKRVFLVCERRDDGGNERPRLSARSTLEQIGKLSLLALAELSAPYRKWQKGSVLHGVSMSGLQKKMRLFGAPSNVLETRSTWTGFWHPYLSNLESGLGLSTFASGTSGLPFATHPEFATLTETGGLHDAKKDAELWSTGSLLRAHLDVIWEIQNASTTSTLTSETTPWLTYLFAVTVANIATSITSLSNSPDSLFSEDSLFLTAIEEFTRYATSRDVKRVITDGHAALMCDDAACPLPSAIARGLGDWAGRPPILLEPESLRGDTAPRREAGESITHDIAPCIGASGRGFERGGDTRGQDAVVALTEVAQPLRSNPYNNSDTGMEATMHVLAQPFTVANTLTQRMGKGINSTVDEGQTPVVTHPIAPCIGASGRGFARGGDTRGQDAYSIITANTGANGLGVTQELSATLDQAQPHAVAFVQNSRDEVRLMNGDGSIVGALAAEAGMKQQCYVAYGFNGDQSEKTHSMGERAEQAPTKRGGGPAHVAYAFQPRIARNGRGDMGDVVSALNAQSGETGKGDAAPCVAFQSSQSGVRVDEVHATLDGNNGSRRHNGALQGMQVRRLTPTECERLQGFPDGHTAILYRNKPAADGPRYKALGNSMAVPVMRHLGIKIMEAVWHI